MSLQKRLCGTPKEGTDKLTHADKQPVVPELEQCLNLRLREVEDILGIPTHNSVCDGVIFSVCGLGKERKKRIRSLKVIQHHES